MQIFLLFLGFMFLTVGKYKQLNPKMSPRPLEICEGHFMYYSRDQNHLLSEQSWQIYLVPIYMNVKIMAQTD